MNANLKENSNSIDIMVKLFLLILENDDKSMQCLTVLL